MIGAFRCHRVLESPDFRQSNADDLARTAPATQDSATSDPLRFSRDFENRRGSEVAEIVFGLRILPQIQTEHAEDAFAAKIPFATRRVQMFAVQRTWKSTEENREDNTPVVDQF